MSKMSSKTVNIGICGLGTVGSGTFAVLGENAALIAERAGAPLQVVHVGARRDHPDCDLSSGPGVLDIFDFLCFQNSFVIGEKYACDCDTSTGFGVCDVFDFLCFQSAFVAGCP